MSYFLTPLNGLIPLFGLVSIGMTLAAFLDVTVHSRASFAAFGKISKTGWLLVLAVGFFIPVAGISGSIAYFARARRWVLLATSLHRGDPPSPENNIYIRG